MKSFWPVVPAVPCSTVPVWWSFHGFIQLSGDHWCWGTDGRGKLGIPTPLLPTLSNGSRVSFHLPRIFYFLCLGLQEVGLPGWPAFWKPVFLFYVFSSDLAVPVFGEMEHFVVVTVWKLSHLKFSWVILPYLFFGSPTSCC